MFLIKLIGSCKVITTLDRHRTTLICSGNFQSTLIPNSIEIFCAISNIKTDIWTHKSSLTRDRLQRKHWKDITDRPRVRPLWQWERFKVVISLLSLTPALTANNTQLCILSSHFANAVCFPENTVRTTPLSFPTYRKSCCFHSKRSAYTQNPPAAVSI
jgi:hypothetical protein